MKNKIIWCCIGFLIGLGFCKASYEKGKLDGMKQYDSELIWIDDVLYHPKYHPKHQ